MIDRERGREGERDASGGGRAAASFTRNARAKADAGTGPPVDRYDNGSLHLTPLPRSASLGPPVLGRLSAPPFR